jgi:site-specific recombinase XerD
VEIEAAKLTSEFIYKGIDGYLWINIHRTKTDSKSAIPLLPKALEILDKYKEFQETDSKGLLLPVSSNQRMNTYLKELADICGITKNLTFYLARHTFATTVTLINGVPMESVSSMLGHRSIKTTQIYSKVVEQKVSQDMAALREKMMSDKNYGQKEGVFLSVKRG